MCGTNAPNGPAWGGATLHAGPVSGTATFTIPFIAGQGVVNGSFTDTTGDSSPLEGFVEIFPNPPAPLNILTGGTPNSVPGPPPSGTCVDYYGVAGTFVIGGSADLPTTGGGGGGSQSSTCDPNSSTTVIDQSTEGVSTMLRVESGSATGGHVWVCARVADGATGQGAWIDINSGSSPTVAPPTSDANYGYCQTPPTGYSANTFPGQHPVSAGQSGPASWMVDVYSGTDPAGHGVVWVCASASSGSTPVGERVIVSESRVGFTQPPSVSPHIDS